MEDLAEKDATEKSDAAREAFLAELALDSKKDVRGGNDNSRHTQEKTKDKKKNKDYRKAKDSKVSIVWCGFMSFRWWLYIYVYKSRTNNFQAKKKRQPIRLMNRYIF